MWLPHQLHPLRTDVWICWRWDFPSTNIIHAVIAHSSLTSNLYHQCCNNILSLFICHHMTWLTPKGRLVEVICIICKIVYCKSNTIHFIVQNVLLSQLSTFLLRSSDYESQTNCNFHFQERPLSARERRRLRQSQDIVSQSGTYWSLTTASMLDL